MSSKLKLLKRLLIPDRDDLQRSERSSLTTKSMSGVTRAPGGPISLPIGPRSLDQEPRGGIPHFAMSEGSTGIPGLGASPSPHAFGPGRHSTWLSCSPRPQTAGYPDHNQECLAQDAGRDAVYVNAGEFSPNRMAAPILSPPTSPTYFPAISQNKDLPDCAESPVAMPTYRWGMNERSISSSYSLRSPRTQLTGPVESDSSLPIIDISISPAPRAPVRRLSDKAQAAHDTLPRLNVNMASQNRMPDTTIPTPDSTPESLNPPSPFWSQAPSPATPSDDCSYVGRYCEDEPSTMKGSKSNLHEFTYSTSSTVRPPLAAQSSSSIPNGPTFFNHAQQVNVGNFTYTAVTLPSPVEHQEQSDLYTEGEHTVEGCTNSTKLEVLTCPLSSTGWKHLVFKASPNALYNSADRFDPPKCDEDTRIEVLTEIMFWISSRYSSSRLLCMTGAAGAGKSALQQTTAERCAQKNILAASFFFNRADPTRNNISQLIPTLAYQLGQHLPALRQAIGAAVQNDPLIFAKSLPAQMQVLILAPVRCLDPQDQANLPYAILIDGLDECVGEQHQAELLTVIRQHMLERPCPFRIFIASRPELPIYRALQPKGHLYQMAYHIRLSDQYDATSDIRRSLWRRLNEISAQRGFDDSWIKEKDVETIVKDASGQYIYAITVIKYVGDPRGSPPSRLRAVVNWATAGSGDRFHPLASLDLLYTNILSSAHHAYESVDSNQYDFLLLFNIYLTLPLLLKDGPSMTMAACDALIGVEENTHDLIISDLRSLVTMRRNRHRNLVLDCYHKSFSDFRTSSARAQNLYVSQHKIVTCAVDCSLPHIYASVNPGTF